MGTWAPWGDIRRETWGPPGHSARTPLLQGWLKCCLGAAAGGGLVSRSDSGDQRRRDPQDCSTEAGRRGLLELRGRLAPLGRTAGAPSPPHLPQHRRLCWEGGSTGPEPRWPAQPCSASRWRRGSSLALERAPDLELPPGAGVATLLRMPRGSGTGSSSQPCGHRDHGSSVVSWRPS